MTKTIYVVQGQTGEYSDHREWLIKAFNDEERAQELVLAATQEAQRLAIKYSGEKRYYDWVQVDDPNIHDPKMEWDYTGVNYTYFAIELCE